MEQRFKVFLASNFSEFSVLRSHLAQALTSSRTPPLSVVDLDDGRARPAAPISVSLDAVRDADVVVLLLGESYGGRPEREDRNRGLPPLDQRSYAHQEYLAALRARRPVLPFFLVGNTLVACRRDESQPPITSHDAAKLAQWKHELMRRHTVSEFSNESLDEVVTVIRESVQTAVFDAMIQPQLEDVILRGSFDDHLADPDDELDGSLAESSPTQDSLDARAFGLEPRERGVDFDPVHAPTRMRALEHWNEGVRAVRLGLRGIAIDLLRRAARIRPLDESCAYWLARMLMGVGTKPAWREALDLARRAACLCREIEDDGEAPSMQSGSGREELAPGKEAASWLLAAGAARRLGELDRAEVFARRAQDLVPWRSEPYLELGVQFAVAARWREAEEVIRKAFLNYPNSLLQLRREPVFLRKSGRLAELTSRLRSEIQGQVSQILDVSRGMGLSPPEEDLSRSSLLRLVAIGRWTSNRLLFELRQRAQRIVAGSRVVQEQERALIERRRQLDDESLATAPGSMLAHLRLAVFAMNESKALRFSIVGIVIVGCVFTVATTSRWPIVASLLAAGMLVGSIARRRRRSYATRAEAEAAAIRTDAGFTVEAADAWRSSVAEFRAHVLAFEAASLRRRLLAPVVSRARARPGDVVTLDPTKAESLAGFTIERTLLPGDLASLVGAEEVDGDARGPELFAILGGAGRAESGSVKQASRSLAYFRP